MKITFRIGAELFREPCSAAQSPAFKNSKEQRNNSEHFAVISALERSATEDFRRKQDIAG
jgi:hypothetical protein